MQNVWNSIVQWLHSLGLHPDPAVLAPLGEAAERIGQAAGGMDLASLLALAAALGWASGFRLYAVVFAVGLLGASGMMVLPGGLDVLAHPLLLVGSGSLLFVEFFADKIPGVDSVWDMLHSVIRVPAGAALAAGVFGADSAAMATFAALMGGTLALSSQAAKTTTRAVINTSPEPLSNVGASLVEDGAAVGALWLALANPAVFAVVLVVVVIALWVLTWMLWRFLAAAVRRIRGWLGGGSAVRTPRR